MTDDEKIALLEDRVAQMQRRLDYLESELRLLRAGGLSLPLFPIPPFVVTCGSKKVLHRY